MSVGGMGMQINDAAGDRSLDMSDFTARLVFVAVSVVGGVNYDARCRAGMFAVAASRTQTDSSASTRLPVVTVGDGYFALSAPVGGRGYNADVAVYVMVNV